MFSYCNYLGFNDTHKPAHITKRLVKIYPELSVNISKISSLQQNQERVSTVFSFRLQVSQHSCFLSLINAFSSGRAPFESMKGVPL